MWSNLQLQKRVNHWILNIFSLTIAVNVTLGIEHVKKVAWELKSRLGATKAQGKHGQELSEDCLPTILGQDAEL